MFYLPLIFASSSCTWIEPLTMFCPFHRTVGGSADALGKLTEADMRFLFVT